MKKILDWRSKQVINVYDELSLWSAFFGELLLKHIPMKSCSHVLDIGCGTGFPLIELAQRFGVGSTIYGVDIWKEALERTREKIRILEIDNIILFEQSADEIPLKDQTLDLVCSNLGVNNFDNQHQVYKEIKRVLKPGGKFCITTNTSDTFHELHLVFLEVLNELGLSTYLLNNSITRRGTKESIPFEIEQTGFRLSNSVFKNIAMRFATATAIFNHSLIRLAFRDQWLSMIEPEFHEDFIKKVEVKVQAIINSTGEFEMTIPIHYLEFDLLD